MRNMGNYDPKYTLRAFGKIVYRVKRKINQNYVDCLPFLVPLPEDQLAEALIVE